MADHPSAKAAFATQFPEPARSFYRFAYYQHYFKGWYWRWDAAARRWMADPGYRAHADRLVQVEEKARAGRFDQVPEWEEKRGEQQAPCPPCAARAAR